MTFLAMAGWQAWLLTAAVAGFAAWLFFRKLRPPRIDVPSLLLWRRVFDQSRALTWWERIRRAVSLVATVVVAVLLALAVARPAPRGGAAAHGRLLIVLDSSLSMRAATADGRTRWQHAVALARQLLSSAGGADVSLATTADGLIEGPTADTALIESALDRLTPDGGADVPWPTVTGTDVVRLVTDGARARPIGPGVTVHSVFEAAPNVAVTALAVRPAPSGATTAEAYLEITNYANVAQPVHLTLSRGRDALADQSVDLAAGETIRQVVPLAATGDTRLRAHISAPHDALPDDDDAVAWIAEAAPLSVLVVSDAPAPLAGLLQRAHGVTASVVPTAAYRSGQEDVLIFDRWLPAQPPGKPALCLAPPAAPWLGAPGGVELLPKWTNVGTHDVVAGVDPLTLDIARASNYAASGLDPIARSDKGTTLIGVVDRPDRRLVIVTFGVGDSNLVFAPAFPVLVGNALEWLARPAAGPPRAPGLVAVPASTTRVGGPDGGSVPITHAGQAGFVRLVAPGFYDVEAGGSRQTIAVNVGSPVTSNLSRTTLGKDQTTAESVPSGRPWWIYLAALALVLVTAEWWTWQRRLTV